MTADKVPLAIREKARDLHYAITDAIRLHHLTPPAHNELRRLLTEALATDYEAAIARADAAEAKEKRDAAALDDALNAIVGLQYLVDALEVALDPRRWNAEIHRAWYTNIPDTIAAFAEIRQAAIAAQQADGEEL